MKLKHVSFVCEDADLIASFYVSLGFVLEKDVPRPEESLRRLVFKLGEGRIQFIQTQGMEAVRSRGWMEHIALELGDFEETVQRLRNQGVKFTREPTLSPSGRRMAFVLDPEGRQIELLGEG